MSRHVTMKWNLRQVMADRGIHQTSALVPMLEECGIRRSREQVYRLVTGTPRRIDVEILAALCDALTCTTEDLMTVVVEEPTATSATIGLDRDPDRGLKIG